MYNDHIFVLGGGTSFESNKFSTIHGFDVETFTWREFQTRPDTTVPIEESLNEQYPAPRRCHTCIQMGNCKFDKYIDKME